VEAVEGLGGGFQFCRLSAEPLFNEFGDILEDDGQVFGGDQCGRSR